MSFFTISGNKLAATVIAAGALVVTGTGVAVSLPGDPAAQVSETESQQPTVAETDSPEPTPTVTETDSPEPVPTETETEEPEPTPTETETEEPEPTPTDTETEEPEPTPTETGDADSPDSTPAGPDATGAAAFGLCNAYTHGGLKNPKSTAYQALVKAASSESSVTAYCETVTAPQDRPDDVPVEPSTGTSASSNEQQVQEQPVPQQRQGAASAGAGNGHANHGAPAAKGNQGHPSNNSDKQSDRGQR